MRKMSWSIDWLHYNHFCAFTIQRSNPNLLLEYFLCIHKKKTSNLLLPFYGPHPQKIVEKRQEDIDILCKHKKLPGSIHQLTPSTIPWCWRAKPAPLEHLNIGEIFLNGASLYITVKKSKKTLKTSYTYKP